MKTKLRRFVPRLLALEDRSLPATFELVGSSLIVTGTAGADQITITDDGTATGIQIDGDGDGLFDATDPDDYIAAAPIVAIFVETLEGDDTVTYNLTGPLSVLRFVDAKLGRGDDIYTANISGQTITADGELHITGEGDGGKDIITLNAQAVTTELGSSLQVFLAGEAGKDTIVLDYTAPEGGEGGAVTLEQKR